MKTIEKAERIIASKVQYAVCFYWKGLAMTRFISQIELPILQTLFCSLFLRPVFEWLKTSLLRKGDFLHRFSHISTE
jgi:hypothetical protein